jgi:predicted phage replisome organizer
MAENKRYYWLKFKEDFFSSKRIKKLRNLGSDFLIIYLKMQLKAIKNDGYLTITGLEDTVADEIALDIDEDPDKVQVTLSYLQSCGLVETENDTLFLPYVAENIGSETASAQRGREYRAKLTDEQKEKERERARIGMQRIREQRKNVTECYEHVTNVEKEIEKDIDIDIEKETPPPNNNISYVSCGNFGRVLLTKEELHDLCHEYGRRETERLILRLDYQIASKGSYYPRHYETIKKWIEEDRAKV